MQSYEYKVIPAPLRGEKERGAKTVAERFAVALTNAMNAMGRDGWEYLRADTLPCEERVGFTGKATNFQHMLVFRRAVGVAAPLVLEEAAPVVPRLGAAMADEGGKAPALGPAQGSEAAQDAG
jgi:hypothetical protein